MRLDTEERVRRDACADVILISPGAIDAYPPVQYQATLLASHGFNVTVITTSRVQGRASVDYQHDGVRVIAARHGLRGPALLSTLTRLVYRSRTQSGGGVEICYDPMGALVSELAPRKINKRILHLHELVLWCQPKWVRIMRSLIKRFDCVVVPDEMRAIYTEGQFGLGECPTVVPNYPILDGEPLPSKGGNEGRYEGVYFGSFGDDQVIPNIVESVGKWNPGATLTLIGDIHSSAAARIREVIKKRNLADRVFMESWLSRRDLQERVARADFGFSMLINSTAQWRTALGASNKRYQLMQFGLPQISDCNPGVNDLIEGGGVGRCVQGYEARDIADAVNAYLDRPEDLKRDGVRARRLHLEKYNYNSVFPRLLGLVRALVG